MIVVNKRYGEWYDIREFVRPNDYMVQQALAMLPDHTPVGMLNWIIANVIYPPGGPDTEDYHAQVAFQPPVQISVSTPDYWNLPSETLRDMIGDCEDRVHLLTSMLRATGYTDSYATIGLYEDMGHAWVSMPNGTGWLVLETTLLDPVSSSVIMPEQPPYRPLFRYNDRTTVVVEQVMIPEIRTSRLAQRGGRRNYGSSRRS